MTASSRLTIDNVSKRFGRVAALQSVSLVMEPGRIYGLAGENGAGKSTLVKILSAVHLPDEGRMELEGRAYAPRSPADAERAGLSVFHQEIPICPNLTVAANVFLGPDLPRRGLAPDWSQMRRECEESFRQWLGLEIDSRQLLGACTVAERQLVLLTRVLRKRARLIVLDEPTTALSPPEVARLFTVIRRLKAQGTTFVFISHLLDELLELSDEIYVLRDGLLAGHLDQAAFDARHLASLIAGRALVSGASSAPPVSAPARLQVRGLSRARAFEDVSFELGAGEIVGIAGVQGSGRSELARALFGAPPPERGDVRINGAPVKIGSPAEALRGGIGYVPEDRKTLGLFHNLDIQTNVGLLKLESASRFGFLARSRVGELTREMVERLRIKMAGPGAPIHSLSGGNQQKVLMARWLAVQPQVLVLNEPTRGVDVGAKDELWRLLRGLAREGTSCLIASSDLDELLQLCDRILVLTQGRLSAAFSTASVNKATLVRAIGQRLVPGALHPLATS